MSEILPSELPDGVEKSSEIVFEILKSSPQARFWKVFAGRYVDNPHNSVKPRELDFLIFMPEDFGAIVYLEAKGGEFRIGDDLRWYRASLSQPMTNPPPHQATSGMGAFKEQFNDPYFNEGSLISLGCAVAFTDWDKEFTRRPAEFAELIMKSDARDSNRLIERLKKYAEDLPSEKVRRAFTFDNQSFSATIDLMDDLFLKMKSIYMPFDESENSSVKRITRTDLETLQIQRLNLTEAQIVNLGAVERNPRSVIDGPAGTGKTILAMELARQRYEAGESVALLCSNSNLSKRFARWAEQSLSSEMGGRIVAGTPTTLPLEALNHNIDLQDRHHNRMSSFLHLEGSLKRGSLDPEWEDFVDETVEDLKAGNVGFDYLIVDEAQNLCDEVFLKLEDALLKGGLMSGRWAMFGDFVNQILITDRTPGDGRDALRNMVRERTNGLLDTNWYDGLLETNCRNTQEITDEVARLVRIESPPRSGVHGPLVQTRYFRSREDLGETLDGLVGEWKNMGFPPRQMVLLSSGTGDEFDTSRTYGGWQLVNINDAELPEIQDREGVTLLSGDSSPRTLRYSDVYDFQGLESNLAIVVLPVTEDQVVLANGVTLPREEHLNRTLYTGMSRATSMLFVVAHESYKGILERRRELYDFDLNSLTFET